MCTCVLLRFVGFFGFIIRFYCLPYNILCLSVYVPAVLLYGPHCLS